MSDELSRDVIDAARRYRDVDVVPKDAIWERIERARRGTQRRTWRGVRAAALWIVVGGALAVSGEHVVEHRARVRASVGAVPPGVAAYLASSDSLLSVFQLAGNDRLRGDVAAWARDLASRSRELEESVAAGDTTLRRLLSDLDLVLIQIAQYASAPAARALERSLIDDALASRRITAQLRSVRRQASGG